MTQYNYDTYEPMNASKIQEIVLSDGFWQGYSDEWRIATVNDLCIELDKNGTYSAYAHCGGISLFIKGLASFELAFKYMQKLNRIIIDLYYDRDFR